jgi:hypothetical protein
MTRARERLLLSGSCDFGRWPEAGAEGLPTQGGAVGRRLGGRANGGAPIAWLAPALMPDLPTLARTLERPIAEIAADGEDRAGVRCWLNSPATVGTVLREDAMGAAMLVG